MSVQNPTTALLAKTLTLGFIIIGINLIVSYFNHFILIQLTLYDFTANTNWVISQRTLIELSLDQINRPIT